jgi:hypothetical protein
MFECTIPTLSVLTVGNSCSTYTYISQQGWFLKFGYNYCYLNTSYMMLVYLQQFRNLLIFSKIERISPINSQVDVYQTWRDTPQEWSNKLMRNILPSVGDIDWFGNFSINKLNGIIEKLRMELLHPKMVWKALWQHSIHTFWRLASTDHLLDTISKPNCPTGGLRCIIYTSDINSLLDKSTRETQRHPSQLSSFLFFDSGAQVVRCFAVELLTTWNHKFDY